LFASIMSPDSNANIVEMLPQLVHGGGLQSLLASGTRLFSGVSSEERVNALSNTVAAKTGVSVGATHALSGIVMTTLFGVLKHYFTKADGAVGQLPTLLGHQLPMVKASMTEDIAGALGRTGHVLSRDLAAMRDPGRPVALRRQDGERESIGSDCLSIFRHFKSLDELEIGLTRTLPHLYPFPGELP